MESATSFSANSKKRKLASVGLDESRSLIGSQCIQSELQLSYIYPTCMLLVGSSCAGEAGKAEDPVTFQASTLLFTAEILRKRNHKDMPCTTDTSTLSESFERVSLGRRRK